MKDLNCKLIMMAGALALAGQGSPARGQTQGIASFGRNGELVCTNLLAASTASVEWASSVLGPWTNTWAGLDAVKADSNGMIRVSVPMFYRVRGTPVPLGMALIPAGSFQMGDSFNEGSSHERPVHSVYVSAFYMDKYPVTKTLWDEVYGWATNHGYSFDNPGSIHGQFTSKGTNHPVHDINWYDAAKWCNARSEKEGRTPAYYTSASQTTVYRSGQIHVQSDWVKWNAGYRLPTEAEWEKAARGGANGRRFAWADADTITHSRANYNSSSSEAYDISPTRGYHPAFNDGIWPYTSPVGYFPPNGYGLYDMAGSIYGYCWDWYGSYPSASQTDPRGPASGTYRMIRGGGSWYWSAFRCRLAYREISVPSGTYSDAGCRSVLPLSQ